MKKLNVLIEIEDETPNAFAVHTASIAGWHRFLHQTAPVNRSFAKRFAGHIVAGLSP